MESAALEIGRLYAFRENPRAKSHMLKVKLLAKVGRVARSALRLHVVSRVPFFCECDDPDCRELVLFSHADYREARSTPITASGHHR
jgi:hypothetical protein